MKTINRVKRQPMKWVKIFASHLSDKWLISEVYEEHMQLNSKKPKNLIKKWVKDPNRHFTKEDTKMTNRYFKWW